MTSSPPRHQILVVHASPVKAKKRVHSSRSYQSDFLEGARLDVLHDLDPTVSQVTLEAFMDSLAPPLPDFDINATMDALELMPDGILSAGGRWKAFDKEPKDQSDGESAVFEPLTEIFNKITAAVIANSNSSLTARHQSVEKESI